ncbi:hypothetical protein, partial [Actinomadura fibrosa]
WHQHNYVRLDPHVQPAHIFTIQADGEGVRGGTRGAQADGAGARHRDRTRGTR